MSEPVAIVPCVVTLTTEMKIIVTPVLMLITEWKMGISHGTSNRKGAERAIRKREVMVREVTTLVRAQNPMGGSPSVFKGFIALS